MSEHKEPIPSMIYNAAVGGHVTNSQQIIDENENKEQSQINAEVKQNLGQGGSVDARITQAKNDIIGGASSACDTLGKAEALISTENTRAQAAEQLLQEQYNALTQNDIIVGTLPASGTKNKIYRVPGTTSYSDYMWNGSSFIKMAEYDNAIDDEPTAGSDNLVKSGGVYPSAEMAKAYSFLKNNNMFDLDKATLNYVIQGGRLNRNNGWYTSDYIDVTDYDKIMADGYFGWFDANKEYISGGLSGANVPKVKPNNAKYIRISNNNENIPIEKYIVAPYYEVIHINKDWTYGTEVAYMVYLLVHSKMNLIDFDKVTYDRFMQNGNAVRQFGWFTSDYIEVDENKTYTFIAFYSWFDANKNYISGGVYTKIVTVSPPSGAKYLRVSGEKAYLDTFFVGEGNSGPVLTKLEDILKNEKDIVIDKSQVTKNNLLLNTVDGSVSNVDGYYTSDYIPINYTTRIKGKGIFIKQANYHCGICIYDKYKNFLFADGSSSDIEATLTERNYIDYPSAAYLRFSFDLQLDICNFTYRANVAQQVDFLFKNVKQLEPEIVENTLIVDKDGTIGTDCDFTDIKSAMDSISDNSKTNRYVVFVKNGVYDITGINYLGFKNYVTVRGETRDGVIIRNSTQIEDWNVSVFDPALYSIPNIEYAAVETATLKILRGKCCVHIDGYAIMSGGKIVLKDLHLINENPEDDVNRGGVNCGLNGGQTVEIINCFGNVFAYAHTRVNPSTEAAQNSFIVRGCHVNYIGFYDISDKVSENKKNLLSVDDCICDYVGIGVSELANDKSKCSIDYHISNSNKFNWIYIFGQGSVTGYDTWFTKYPICSSIHHVVENHTGSTILKGTFVSAVRSTTNGVISSTNPQAMYRYNIVPYNGGELFGVAMEDIADGESGIIQVEGKILIADNNYSAGDYITLNTNGNPEIGTKANAIGIVTDANQQYLGTMVLLKKREYDYIL